jgi:RNA polymerase sigma-70 factor (ECF subfamily)
LYHFHVIFANRQHAKEMSIADLDKELLVRLLDNQERSWEDFVDRFLGLVLHVIDYTASRREIRLSIGDRTYLCENVFAALAHDHYRVLRNFKERSSLASYLCVTVRRMIIRILLNQAFAGSSSYPFPETT